MAYLNQWLCGNLTFYLTCIKPDFWTAKAVLKYWCVHLPEAIKLKKSPLYSSFKLTSPHHYCKRHLKNYEAGVWMYLCAQIKCTQVNRSMAECKIDKNYAVSQLETWQVIFREIGQNELWINLIKRLINIVFMDHEKYSNSQQNSPVSSSAIL